jgi:hypothetical protein
MNGARAMGYSANGVRAMGYSANGVRVMGYSANGGWAMGYLNVAPAARACARAGTRTRMHARGGAIVAGTS